MVKIIGILGKSKSGKDTAADSIADKTSFAKIAFADPMKRFLYSEFGFSEEQLWGSSEKRSETLLDPNGHDSFESYISSLGIDSRKLLISLGTDWGRDMVDENLWIQLGMRQARKLLAPGSNHIYYRTHGVIDISVAQALGIGEGFYVKKPKGVVFSDCRFPNEVDAIHKMDGVVIRIKREDDRKDFKHASSTPEVVQNSISDDQVDYVIDNNRSLDFLYGEINEILADIFHK